MNSKPVLSMTLMLILLIKDVSSGSRASPLGRGYLFSSADAIR